MLADEAIAEEYWIQMMSDRTRLSVTLKAKLTVVRDRGVHRRKYHRLVTEEDYLVLGDALYWDMRLVSMQIEEHDVSDAKRYDNCQSQLKQ